MSPPSSTVAQRRLPSPSKANSVLPAPTTTLMVGSPTAWITSGEAGEAPSPTCQSGSPSVLIAYRFPSDEPNTTLPGGSGCGSTPRITAGVVTTRAAVLQMTMIAPVVGSSPYRPAAPPTNNRPFASTGDDPP